MERRDFIKYSALGLAGLCLPGFHSGSNGKPLNILFIGVDDLRPELNCYGATHMHTPHIDSLARSGVQFNRAYVQQAVCSASRASLLTGCRPDTTTVDYPYNDYFTKDFLPTHPSLPKYFFDQGFYARSFGKIHHGAPADLLKLSKPMFDHRFYKGKRSYSYALEENHTAINAVKTASKKWATGNSACLPYEIADVEDEAYPDGRIANGVVQELADAAQQDKPFCLSVGFFRPHLPFNAPKKYWDLYKREDIALAPYSEQPEDAPAFVTATKELPTYKEGWGSKKNPIDEEKARLLRHGYYACVSYIDAQIGKVLAALDANGQREHTLIVLWSDHGWHLGDNGCWGKHTNFERATRAPLIISGPSIMGAGQECNALVEYVDLFPTICDLIHTPQPNYLEGSSLAPLLAEPNMPWKDAAFSQWPLKNREGYAIRTDRHRYIEWRNRKSGIIEARELYDHNTDPNETVNIAAAHSELCTQLSARLGKGSHQ